MIPSRTDSMDGAREQFLSRAGFSEDQNSRIGRRYHLHLPHDPLHNRAAAYNLLKCVRNFAPSLVDIFLPVSLPQVIHEGDPAEGR